MSNQITTLFGEQHDRWMADLDKAVRREEKRVLLDKTSRAIRREIRLRKKEIAKLQRVALLLDWRASAMDGYGFNLKSAKQALRRAKS